MQRIIDREIDSNEWKAYNRIKHGGLDHKIQFEQHSSQNTFLYSRSPENTCIFINPKVDFCIIKRKYTFVLQ